MTGREFTVSSVVVGLDTERILRTLAEHDVEYVLVGGLAAIAHGSTLATADADVVPRGELDNLERVLDALETLDAGILASERRIAMEAGELWEATELRRDGAGALLAAPAWHFTTSAGPVDVVMTATGVGRYEAYLEAAEERTAFGIEVRVAGLDDLIRAKESLDRPKDRIMLEELRELRDGRDA